jgi:hypothetical protein
MNKKPEPISIKQETALMKAGYHVDELKGMSLREASRLMDELKRNKEKTGRWERPAKQFIEKSTSSVELETAASTPLRIDKSELREIFAKQDEAEWDETWERIEGLAIDTLKQRDGERGVGVWLIELKEKSCKHGEFLPMLASFGMKPRIAQVRMKLARLDVPGVVADELAGRGIRLNTHIDTRSLRIAKAAAESYKVAQAQKVLSSNTQPVAHLPQDTSYQEANAVLLSEREEAAKSVDAAVQSEASKAANKSAEDKTKWYINRIRSEVASLLSRVPESDRRDVLVAAFKAVAHDFHLEVTHVATAA